MFIQASIQVGIASMLAKGNCDAHLETTPRTFRYMKSVESYGEIQETAPSAQSALERDTFETSDARAKAVTQSI